MDISNHFSLLDMIEHPAFYVRNGIIICSNNAAKHMLFEVGEPISNFLRKDAPAYAAFQGGCLYLNVVSAHVVTGASVTRIEDCDLFLIDTEGSKLDAYALAALKLKVPLSNIVTLLEDLIEEDQQYAERAGHLRKNLSMLNRIILNMADASWLRNDSSAKHEPTNFTALFAEIMEQMDDAVRTSGDFLEFTNLTEPVYGRADRGLLLRAVSNIISNAIKFSPKGSLIRASLTRKDNYLYFTVSDPGDSQYARCNVFTRYLRPAFIDDIRFGIGLGMSIIHSVAVDHGGTVLVDTPDCGGTRVTMSIELRKCDQLLLKTPVKFPGQECTTGTTTNLIEFSEVLPASAYEDKPI